MHVYVWEHKGSLYYKTAEWMFTKLGRDKVLMAWHMHKDVWPYLPRADPGRDKIGHGRGEVGSPPSKHFFFRPKRYSNKPNS